MNTGIGFEALSTSYAQILKLVINLNYDKYYPIGSIEPEHYWAYGAIRLVADLFDSTHEKILDDCDALRRNKGSPV